MARRTVMIQHKYYWIKDFCEHYDRAKKLQATSILDSIPTDEPWDEYDLYSIYVKLDPMFKQFILDNCTPAYPAWW